MGKTTIEWTDESSNPIRFQRKDTGKRGWACVRKSAGCTHCFAERRNKWVGTGFPYNAQSMELVEPFLVEKEIKRLLNLKEGRRIFLCDMTDLFGEFMPKEHIFTVLAIMAIARHQTFQVLTKRADRMEEFLSDPETPIYLSDYVEQIAHEFHYCAPEHVPDFQWPLPNVHLGVTVEDSTQYDRIEHLLHTPAAVRFVSCEPLLSALDLSAYLRCEWEQDRKHPIHWKPGDIVDREKYPIQGYPAVLRPRLDQVIVGFETGTGARPGHPGWVRSLRDQCQAAGVKFFFKSWGEWAPQFDSYLNWQFDTKKPEFYGTIQWWTCASSTARGDEGKSTPVAYDDGGKATILKRVGRKLSGRELDGCEWSETPDQTVKEVVAWARLHGLDWKESDQ